MEIAILFDGDYTRRLIKRRLGRNPTAQELEQFARLCLGEDEHIGRAYYYDCPPYGDTKKLPVTKTEKNFSNDPVYAKAVQFQKELVNAKFFKFRKGRLSFNGWSIKERSIESLLANTRTLNDDDFEPVLTQKQVDMRIGLDIANISHKHMVERILLATADSDFVPAIHYAREKGVQVVLISDGDSALKLKKELIHSCNDHRIITL